MCGSLPFATQDCTWLKMPSPPFFFSVVAIALLQLRVDCFLFLFFCERLSTSVARSLHSTGEADFNACRPTIPIVGLWFVVWLLNNTPALHTGRVYFPPALKVSLRGNIKSIVLSTSSAPMSECFASVLPSSPCHPAKPYTSRCVYLRVAVITQQTAKTTSLQVSTVQTKSKLKTTVRVNVSK